MALYQEVLKLNLPFLAQGAAETIVTNDRFLGSMPVHDVGEANVYRYNQEATIAAGNSGSVIAMDGTFTPQSASYTQTDQLLTLVGASFNLPVPLQTPEAIATETAKKAKAVARSMGSLLINATIAGSTYFTGLAGSISGSATQDILVASVGSGSFSLGALDSAIALVKAGRANMIVTSTAGARYFKNAIRSSGTTAEYLQMPNYGAPFLAYDGIPVVVSDWVPDGTVYAIYADENDGVTLWSNFGRLVTVRQVEVANSVSDNWTVAAAFGLIVPTPLAVARITGITS